VKVLPGKILKAFRVERGLSTRGLAKILGVCPPTIIYWEKHGHINPKWYPLIEKWINTGITDNDLQELHPFKGNNQHKRKLARKLREKQLRQKAADALDPELGGGFSRINPELVKKRVSNYKGRKPIITEKVLSLLKTRDLTAREITEALYGADHTFSNRSAINYKMLDLWERGLVSRKEIARNFSKPTYLYSYIKDPVPKKEKFYKHGHVRTLRDRTLKLIREGINNVRQLAVELYGEATRKSINRTTRVVGSLKKEGLVDNPSRGHWVAVD
jgi:transcriptional regulator with XRE-family HTH domain